MPPRKTVAALDDLLKEKRTFPPPVKFKKLAAVRDASLYRKARRNPQKFWADMASELV